MLASRRCHCDGKSRLGASILDRVSMHLRRYQYDGYVPGMHGQKRHVSKNIIGKHDHGSKVGEEKQNKNRWPSTSDSCDSWIRFLIAVGHLIKCWWLWIYKVYSVTNQRNTCFKYCMVFLCYLFPMIHHRVTEWIRSHWDFSCPIGLFGTSLLFVSEKGWFVFSTELKQKLIL